ncbi:MAG: RHS repeat protein, partial [Cytophagaceae bacterium]
AIIAIAPDGTVGIRDGEGRLVAFEEPTPNGPGIQSERLALFLNGNGSYRLWHMDELLWYSFGVTTADREAPQPLQAIEDASGFAIRFAYEEGGHLHTITDSAGRVLRVDTNAQGQLTAIYSPQTAEIPSFPLVRYEYDEWGNLLTAYDAEDQPMRYRYQAHKLVQRTARMGTNWYFEYENSKPGARCMHTWGDGGLLDYTLYYDSETQTTVLDSYQQPTVYTHQDGLVTRQVDALGGEQRWTYSESGQLLAYLDALGNVTRYEYDEQGRQTTLTLSDGKTVTTHYDKRGLVSGVSDVRGNQWIWVHNERGNLLSRTNPLGAMTTFDYDEEGRLNSMTNALSQTIHLRYDQHHNVAHIVTPDEQIRSRSYDELGRLTAITDPTGATQQRRYDRLGQLVELQEADGIVRRLSYDASGNLSQVQQHDEIVFVFETWTA